MTSDAQTQLADIVSLDRARRLRDKTTTIDPVIAWWKCRVGVCLTRCGVTQTAIEVLALFNAELKRRREKPIDADDVMLCDAHKDKLVKARW